MPVFKERRNLHRIGSWEVCLRLGYQTNSSQPLFCPVFLLVPVLKEELWFSHTLTAFFAFMSWFTAFCWATSCMHVRTHHARRVHQKDSPSRHIFSSTNIKFFSVSHSVLLSESKQYLYHFIHFFIIYSLFFLSNPLTALNWSKDFQFSIYLELRTLARIH